VSGMVKNWGACGSMAPPTTVDIMVDLPLPQSYRALERTTRRWLQRASQFRA
jgi:hypothetical protein